MLPCDLLRLRGGYCRQTQRVPTRVCVVEVGSEVGQAERCVALITTAAGAGRSFRSIQVPCDPAF